VDDLGLCADKLLASLYWIKEVVLWLLEGTRLFDLAEAALARAAFEETELLARFTLDNKLPFVLLSLL